MSRAAPRTYKKLEEVIRANYHRGVEGMAEEIDKFFNVKQNVGYTERPPQPAPEVGQVWINRRSRRKVVVTSIDPGFWRRRVRWECIDGSPGQKSGGVYDDNWGSIFDFLSKEKA